MMAQQCGLGVGEFVCSMGDTHIYRNHLEQIDTQLKRKPYPLPSLVIKREPESIFDYRYEDFELVGYEHHDVLRAPIAV